MRQTNGMNITRLTLGGLPHRSRELKRAARIADGAAEVSRGHKRRIARDARAEQESHSGSEHSMSAKPAEQPAGTPEQSRSEGSGTPGTRGHAQKTDTACEEQSGKPAPMTMEEVLRRENMLKAYRRVVKNGGAPGMDGMMV